MASPVHFNAGHPDETIRPALAGTESILNSARQHGKDVKRVVYTSSTAAILNSLPHPQVFDESSWNHTSIEECNTKGKDASPVDMYRASKALAERAACNFIEKHKDTLQFDLAVINPPYVFGPMLHEVDKAENLGISMSEWYKAVVQVTKNQNAAVRAG